MLYGTSLSAPFNQVYRYQAGVPKSSQNTMNTPSTLNAKVAPVATQHAPSSLSYQKGMNADRLHRAEISDNLVKQNRLDFNA